MFKRPRHLENIIGSKENVLKYPMPFLISPFSKLYFPVVAQRMSKDKKKAQAFTYESQNEIKLLPTASLLVQSATIGFLILLALGKPHDWNEMPFEMRSGSEMILLPGTAVVSCFSW